MPLLMFRSQKSIKSLVEGIEKRPEEYLEIYRSGGFDDVLKDEYTAVIDEDFPDEGLSALIPGEGPDHDIENAVILWETLTKVTPRIARQQRFWVYLTHTMGLEYTRSRWPLDPDDDEQALKQIRLHYIPTDSARGIDRNNALSRLWISAYVCNKITGVSLRDALDIFLFKTDFRENIIGRPEVFRSDKILNTLFRVSQRIIQEDEGERFFQRKNGDGPYKEWLKIIDAAGGRLLLDALPEVQLEEFISDVAELARSRF